MAQRPGFDTSRVTTGDKILLAGAGAFFIWTFIPVWYKLNLGELFGTTLGSANFNGFRGVTLVAWLFSLLALAWRGANLAGVRMNLNIKPGLVDLALAGLGLLFTLLGLVAKPTGLGISWGIFVAVLLALAWAYGAWMKYQEPATVAPPTAPPTSGGSGFTT